MKSSTREGVLNAFDMTKEEIIKFIHRPIQLEPIYDLVDMYEDRLENSEKANFIESLKEIAKCGTIFEQFAALTIIGMTDNALDCEILIKRKVDNLDFKKEQLLIKPLLSLCASISQKWSLDFIKRVMREFKEDKVNYLGDLAISSFILTPNWLEIIDEINESLFKNDDSYFIDFFAYFKWKKSEGDWAKLIEQIDDSLLSKLSILQPQIDKRYKMLYKSLKK